MSFEFLWYIPNQVTAGHRGEPVAAGHNSLDTLTSQARAVEDHGWKGALIGAGWGRPDTFTVATALASRTATFEPLIAIRPGYWHPANFAKAAATLDHLTGGRPHPKLYFGGASPAAEKVAATEADVQLFWGEPLAGVRERIERLRSLGGELGREHPPLEFGLRVTTLVRDTTEQAWADAEAKIADMAGARGTFPRDSNWQAAAGQQRLARLASRGEVLDDNLYTTPGKFGGEGAATTWLVGSAQDVARSLRKYASLGITHFVLSDTPYLREIKRQGDQLLPLLRG